MPRRKLIVALVAAAIGIATSISLGNWQMRRGDAKLALRAQAEAAERAPPVDIAPSRLSINDVAAALPRKVRVSGVFDPAGTVYLDSRILNGVAGFYVITPLVIGEGLPALLVDRGWKAHDLRDRARIAAPMPPSGRVSVEGLAVARPSALLELGGKPELRVPGFWQNLNFSAYEQATGRSVARFVIQQSADAQSGNAADALRREWPRLASGAEKNRGYAFQWYAIAVLIAVLAVFFGRKAWRER
jgi:surfeit locus 1 family protein